MLSSHRNLSKHREPGLTEAGVDKSKQKNRGARENLFFGNFLFGFGGTAKRFSGYVPSSGQQQCVSFPLPLQPNDEIKEDMCQVRDYL